MSLCAESPLAVLTMPGVRTVCLHYASPFHSHFEPSVRVYIFAHDACVE